MDEIKWNGINAQRYEVKSHVVIIIKINYEKD